jgi:hypothetical protein
MQPLKVNISNSKFSNNFKLIEKNLAYLAIYNYGSVAIQVIWDNVTYTVAALKDNQPLPPFIIDITGCIFDVELDIIIPTGGVAVVHKAKDTCAINQ